MRGAARALAFAGAVALATASGAAGQDLADFDYEDLSFRGIAFDGGWIWPSKVDATDMLGVRLDLGYLGPGLRILPRIGYWSSFLDDDEVARLEGRVASLIVGVTPEDVPPDVDLGAIRWSDLVLGMDAQFVWSVPFDLLTYAGVGAAAHIQNGSGPAIDGTFVEDLLDGTVFGVNAHTGLEYPINDRIRIFSTVRYELMGDLQYLQFGGGLQIMFTGPAPGEERTR